MLIGGRYDSAGSMSGHIFFAACLRCGDCVLDGG